MEDQIPKKTPDPLASRFSRHCDRAEHFAHDPPGLLGRLLKPHLQPCTNVSTCVMRTSASSQSIAFAVSSGRAQAADRTPDE